MIYTFNLYRNLYILKFLYIKLILIYKVLKLTKFKKKKKKKKKLNFYLKLFFFLIEKKNKNFFKYKIEGGIYLEMVTKFKFKIGGEFKGRAIFSKVCILFKVLKLKKKSNFSLFKNPMYVLN